MGKNNGHSLIFARSPRCGGSTPCDSSAMSAFMVVDLLRMAWSGRSAQGCRLTPAASRPTRRLKSSGGSQLAPPADAGGFASPAASAGSSSPPAMTASSSSAGGDKRNVSEAIDDLRSEVSRARYEVQKLKNKNS